MFYFMLYLYYTTFYYLLSNDKKTPFKREFTHIVLLFEFFKLPAI
jgi:hypothetical protein